MTNRQGALRRFSKKAQAFLPIRPEEFTLVPAKVVS